MEVKRVAEKGRKRRELLLFLFFFAMRSVVVSFNDLARLFNDLARLFALAEPMFVSLPTLNSPLNSATAAS